MMRSNAKWNAPCLLAAGVALSAAAPADGQYPLLDDLESLSDAYWEDNDWSDTWTPYWDPYEYAPSVNAPADTVYRNPQQAPYDAGWMNFRTVNDDVAADPGFWDLGTDMRSFNDASRNTNWNTNRPGARYGNSISPYADNVSPGLRGLSGGLRGLSGDLRGLSEGDAYWRARYEPQWRRRDAPTFNWTFRDGEWRRVPD